MISAVKPYARARMEALSYVEWEDGFNSENIPSTMLNTAYFVETGKVTSERLEQQHIVVRVPFTVKLFRAAERDVKSLVDTMWALVDAAIDEVMNVTNRTTYGSGLVNVLFNSASVEPLAQSNDNGVIGSMEFTAIVNKLTV
jgi:hypothetical protein